jgi:hypothetical protein
MEDTEQEMEASDKFWKREVERINLAISETFNNYLSQ